MNTIAIIFGYAVLLVTGLLIITALSCLLIGIGLYLIAKASLLLEERKYRCQIRRGHNV